MDGAGPNVREFKPRLQQDANFDETQQARLGRIAVLADALNNELTGLEAENHREALRVYRTADPANAQHPAIQRLRTTERATFEARGHLQTGLMWLRRATTRTERF